MVYITHIINNIYMEVEMYMNKEKASESLFS